jgi:hypothetical protein
MPRVPLTPFSGWKYVAIPELPAGHATMSLGPMMVKLLSGSGEVTTT